MDESASGNGLSSADLDRVRDTVLARRVESLTPYLLGALAVALIGTGLSANRLAVAVGGVAAVGVLFVVSVILWLWVGRRTAMTGAEQDRFVAGSQWTPTSSTRIKAFLVLAGLGVYLYVAEGAAGPAVLAWIAVGFLGSTWARLRWGRRWLGPTSLDILVLQYYAGHRDDPLFAG
jgi:hypothetical protein